MMPHKTWLFLLFLCAPVAFKAPPTKKNKPSALSRALTTIFGIPPQDLKSKNFIKNSLPNLISQGLRPAALNLYSSRTTQPDHGTLKKWGLITEATLAVATLCLRILALGYTHIYKKSPSKPFSKTAIESIRNSVFALFHAALTSNSTKDSLVEMEATQHPWHTLARRTHALALLALEGFYLLRRFKSAHQRHSFLHNMRNSKIYAKSFVASRKIPAHMVGKKYLTFQTPQGYLLKNGEELIARMHTIGELIYHAINGVWMQKITNSSTWKTSQEYKQGMIDFLTKPRIPQLQFGKMFYRSQENTSSTAKSISLATLLCDIPYASHIFILKQDVLSLSKADQLLLYTFIREDHLHAVARIHTYLKPLTNPF